MKNQDNCIQVVDGEAEAQQVKSLLAANGIPCHFEGEALRTTHGFTLNGLGVVRICVPDAFVIRAKDLLKQADAGNLQVSADGGADDEDGTAETEETDETEPTDETK